MDTIYALASGSGRAGIAVVRVSGPQVRDVCCALVGRVPPVRHASLRKVIWRDDLIDDALVTYFEAGHSFTGEDVVEFGFHGSVAVLSAALRALSEQPGLRIAEAGEFTRRALENGRLDLTQVEGLADLIDAETEVQRKQAQRVLSGALSRRTEIWRSNLLRAAALMEATIDFADEDVPVDVLPEVRGLISATVTDLQAELLASASAERVRDGFEVAIVGGPNAGKSTLLNRISGRDVSLISDVPGTTRDVLEVRLDLEGLPVTFLDTAGLRDSDDAVEQMGVERALQRAKQADLRVFLLGGAEDGRQWLSMGSDDLVVGGKADLPRSWAAERRVSGLTGAGVKELLAEISSRLKARVAVPSTLIRHRHRQGSTLAVAALAAALAEADQNRVEFAAEHVREAIRVLDGLIGRVDVEALLGEIFASFCIGK